MSKLYEGDPFDGHLSKSDLQLIERALRANWPISPATQVRLIRKAAAIALQKETGNRTFKRVMDVILKAQANQLAQGKLDLAREIFEARSRGNETFNLSQLVAEAEALALSHKPAERPGSGDGDGE